MVIVLLGIIGTGAAMLLFQGSKSLEAGSLRQELTAEGTLALERISREIRLITCTTAGNACNPQAADITAWTAAEVRFVNTDYEGRGFRADAGALKLRQGSGAADPEDILANNVASATFEYLKNDGVTPAAAVNEIWLINVSLALTKKTESVTLKASAHPRSFR